MTTQTSLQHLLPHETRWGEIERIVSDILEYQIDGQNVVLFPWVAGGAYELGAVIGSIPGSSKTLLGAAVLNDQDWSHGKLSFPATSSCTPEVGDGLAAANFLEIQKVKGESHNVKTILGIGVTATIATSNPDAGKRGGQRACISLRRYDGTRRVTLRFQHSSELTGTQREKRKFQSQLIDLVVLNLIAESLGITQVPLYPEYRLSLEEGELVQTSEGQEIRAHLVGQDTLLAERDFLLIEADGSVHEQGYLSPQKHVLIPCSANPFTPSHDEIARHLAEAGRSPVFVINGSNAEKGAVDDEELARRARGFIGRWPVVLLRGKGEFLKMAEAFACDFAIGGDTAMRIFLPRYCEEFGGGDNVYARFKATGVRFTVFPRHDRFGRLRAKEAVPSMYQDLFIDAPDVIPRFSSTAVRKTARLPQAGN